MLRAVAEGAGRCAGDFDELERSDEAMRGQGESACAARPSPVGARLRVAAVVVGGTLLRTHAGMAMDAECHSGEQRWCIARGGFGSPHMLRQRHPHVRRGCVHVCVRACVPVRMRVYEQGESACAARPSPVGARLRVAAVVVGGTLLRTHAGMAMDAGEHR